MSASSSTKFQRTGRRSALLRQRVTFFVIWRLRTWHDGGMYMIPLRIVGATHVMIAPRGMEGEVRGCVSRWEPTPDELAILNAGGSVELWVMGQQPPVALRAVP